MTLYGKWAKQSEKKRKRPAQKDRTQRDLLVRSVIAATTFTFFSPMVASADIISGDNAITTVDKQNNIYTVESHKYFGNSAVNWFSQFGLGANEIANLYFGTQADNSKLNLYNFVDSKIDVNGTVNAIQNNKVGGNLFFLSKEGIAVGAGGVINAGSLTLLTPNEDYYEKFIDDNEWEIDGDDFAAEEQNMAEMNIPLSPTGEIMVKGRINAPNGIGMKASSITVDSTAQLKTGDIDFTSLVNAGETDNTVFDGSQNLTVTKTDSGDIVLAAYADVRNKKDEEFAQTILGITGDEETAANNNTIEASVTNKGVIDAAGNVTITAEAANGQQFYASKFSEPNGLGTNETAAHQIAQSVAKVSVADGTVSGQNVSINATADNSYLDSDSLVKMVGINVLGAFTVNMDAAYAVLKGKASVDVGKDAVIEAKNAARTDAQGNTVDALSITADSRVQGSVGATTAFIKLANVKGSNALPSTSVGYIELDNEATINIDGTLKSAGNTKIDANADTQMIGRSSAKTTTIAGDESILEATVLVANGDTRATVNIGQTAQMAGDHLVGDLDIDATTTSEVHTEAIASGGNGALGSTAVNVTTYDSSADVNIGAAIEAEDVSVAAGNLISDNTILSNNTMGSSALMSKMTDGAASSKSVDALKNSVLPWLVGKMPKKIQDAANAPAQSSSVAELGKMMSIGAAIVVAEESNQANLTVKDGASIVARGAMGGPNDGDVSLVANNNILDTKMSALGKTNNNGKTGNNQVIVSAGVLVADMDNEANVIIEAQDTTDHKVIEGKDIGITASTTMEYNRVKMMIGELLWAIEKVETAFGSSSEYQSELEDMKQLLTEADEKAAEDPDYLENTEFLDLAMQLGQAADGLRLDSEDMSSYFQMMDLIAVKDIFAKAASFTNLSNYGNFTVNNTTGGKKYDAGGAKAAIAGNVNLATISAEDRVIIGKNAVIDAGGDLDIEAQGKTESVNITGGLPGSTGGNVGIGGSVSIQRFDTESVVMVAEGAQLKGENVSIVSDNDMMQVGVVTQSGMSSSASVEGMANLMFGDSNSLVFVDDEAKISAEGIKLDALNDTTITNVAGGFSMGSDVAVGVGLALTEYEVNNMAGIVDIDHDKTYTETEETDDTTSEVKRENSAAQAINAARAASGLTNEQSASLFGSTAVDKDGSVTANRLAVNAQTTGTINAVSVAGGITTSDDSGQKGMFAKLGDWFNDTKLVKGIQNIGTKMLGNIQKLDDKVGGKLNDKFGSNVNNSLNAGNADQGGGSNSVNTNGAATPPVSIAAAGSASVNLIDKNTGAVIDGANITLHKDTPDQGSSLSVTAKDDGFVGAWSGSAGISWKTTTLAAHTQASVGMAGAIGMNLTESTVQSTISDSVIYDADELTNTASSEGATVAAGLGMTVVRSAGAQSGAPVSIAGTVSVNDVDDRVYAHLADNTVTRSTAGDTTVTNSAYSKAVQVTGGVNVSAVSGTGRKFASAVGGAVTVAELENEVEARIDGGTYDHIDDIEVSSMYGAVQVGSALGIGAQAGSEAGFAFEGAAVYNETENKVGAVIDGATITANTVDVLAKDTLHSANEWQSYIEQRGIDATGQETIDNADSLDEVGTIDNDGSVIVSAALAVAGSSGSAGIAGAVAIDDIENDRTATITNSNITAGAVSAKADADSLMVGVAAGAGGSKHFGGTGSVGWHEVENDVTATVDKSQITADELDVLADNDALLINVAGQISAGKVGVGATLAYQGIDNVTGAYIQGSSLKGYHDVIAVSAKGENTGDIISVGAGVGAAGTAAVSGTVAINRGANDTEAIIGKSADDTRSTIEKAGNIEVKASDDTDLIAVAGGIGVSKTAAVGGAVAYNDIGGAALGAENAVQNVTASLDDTDITTNVSDASVKVGAHDDTDITTVAVGIGGSGKVAVQGAAATSLINKNVTATMTNTNIDKNTSGASRADVTVSAQNTSEIDGSASVVAGSGTAAIGAGVTVNRIQQDTSALLAGGKQNVNGIVVKSVSQPTIFSIGIGGGIAGTAGIAGSVAVNMIDDNSIARISDGADITAEGSVGVISENDQVISNYVGALSGAGTAAVGASVGVNTMTGDSEASVTDSTITAKGSTSHTVTTNSMIADDAIVDEVIGEDVVDPDHNLKENRQQESLTGLVVDSSATHNVRSLEVTAGGSGGVAVEATVNVTTLKGSTTATVENTNINAGGAADDADVTVRARDYANSTAFVGGVAGSMYAGVVPADDTNLMDRTVRAELTGSGLASGMTVNGDDVIVLAESKQGISSFGVGAAAAVEGAGVGAVVSVITMDGITEAIAEDVDINAQTAEIKADRLARMNAGNISGGLAAIGAGVGASIGVMADDSEVRALVSNSTIDTDGANTIAAENTTELLGDLFSFGFGAVGGGVAGTVIVGNIDNTVETSVTDSTLTGSVVSVTADEMTKIDAHSGEGSGGLGSVNAGVAVNTIDSKTTVTVEDSTVSATDDVIIQAAEARDIAQIACSGSISGAGIGANVMVTNIGKTIDETNMVIDTTDQGDVDIKALVQYANDEINGNLSGLTYGLTDAEKNDVNDSQGSADLGTGNALVSVNVIDSDVTATDEVTIATDIKENISMTNETTGGGLISVMANVGVANVHHNLMTNITDGSTITADDVVVSATVGNTDDGSIRIETEQGSALSATIGAAVGIVNVSGNIAVNVADSSMTGDEVTVLGQDTTKAVTESKGQAINVAEVGAIVSETYNDSDIYVTIADSTLNEGETSGSTEIRAENDAETEAIVIGGATGLVDGVGLRARAGDTGKTEIKIDKASLGGQTIEVESVNAPIVKATIDNDTYGILAVQVSDAKAILDAEASLTVSAGSSFLADTVSFESIVGKDGETTVTSNVEAVNGSAAAGSGSLSTAEVKATANTELRGGTYKTATDLSVIGTTKTTAKADIENLNIGVLLATGNNHATVNTENTTSVTVAGGGNVGSLTVQADGSADSDARATSDGGGAISADEAARAESKLTSNMNVNVSGNWNIADFALISAVQNDRSNVNAEAVRGGAATFSGTTAKNDIAGTANITLDGNITADSIDVLAKNNITAGDAYTYAAEGDNYSAVNIQGNTATMNVDKKANVSIDANVTTDKYQTYEALTEADITNRSVTECGMLLGDGFAITDTNATVTDTVTLGQGKTLITNDGGTGSDITLAASDTLDITSTSEVDIPAAAVSGAEADTDTTVARNNTVTVNGTIQSKNDINLYADKDADGNKAALTMDTAAEAYNHSVIPIAAPSIDNKLTQNNQVVVSSTGRGESVRHIDISADTGKESIREMTGTYTWYGGGTDQDVSYVGTSEGQEAKYKTASNTVRVDGTLIAGTNDVQNVVISGNVAPPNSVAANGSGDSEYTITLNGAAMEGATVTTMDYGNVLFDRYQETTKLMNEYYGKYEESGSEKDLSAYLGYKAEQERIFAQMEKAGLTVSVTKDGVTMTYPIEVDGNSIYIVELPDIVSSGGNINIDTDTLYGQGSFDAHGTPEINIKNESTAYLKLNDLTIGEVGGGIVYNGQSIGDNGNDMIAGLNRDKSKTVNFAAIMADGEVGDAAVFVHSTNTGAMQIRPEGQANGETHSWTPIKTIEIGGVIENLLGTVTITNDAGDIIIQNDDNTAGIEAKIVKLTATGAVAQGFTDGIVNIGGDPTSQWSDIADQKQEDARLELDNSGHENETHGMMGADLPEAEAENGNWIVGGEVYINASDINVNGTIQSGFDRYQVTIPEDAVDNIDYNDASKIEYINGNKVYKINDGNKTVRRDNGKYAYEVQAYYDPSTDKIIIDDITTQGGKIYLTGRISSTGNGKIVALDGGADINIESFSDKTLVIGKIDNSEAVGLIRITDLNKMTETEYTRNSTKVTDLKTNGVETTTGDNTNTNYSVQEGLRYNWTTGTETVEKKTYHKESTEDWWGLGKADVTEELERYEETHSPTEVVSGSGDKPQGAYIDRVDEIGADGKDYVIIYDNDMKSEEHSEVEQWKSTSGFLGWYQTNHYRWTVTTGSSQTYQHSVKADRPIDIGFIDGGSDQQIYIRGQKDVDLTGTIISANADSSMDITAFRGTLSQADGTTLVADSIKLDAETGIAGIDITAMKQTDLGRNVDVIMQTVSGDIDVTVDGNVTVNRAKTGEGSIVLSATGDILKGSETVIADRIDLVSGGKIDLIVNGGQDPRTDDSMSASVSAQAKGNITLTEEDGDMRIGTIVSQEGDVTLTAKNGSIVDVIPTEDISDTPDAAVRIQRWQDLGLIEGDGEYIYERQEDANDYRESITEAYAYYAEQKAYYESAPSEQKSELYLKLAERFDGYASADAFLADSLQYQELTETLTAEDYDWTKEQLLYAIHESVINKTSATHQDKVANITGKNITLKAENGSIGIDLDTAEVVSLKGLSSNVDALKKVANAENSDVLWFEGADDPYIDENGTAHYDVVVINHQKPLGIAASGTVKADAKADIFLAGRETSMDNISDSLYETLTVDHIISQNGDVRIIGERALRVAESSTLHIQGQDVILEGGKKGIGTADNAVCVQVGDELMARSEGDLYIEQKDGDLTVLTMYAAGDAVLSAGGDILAGEDDSGYINVRGELTLRAGGDIGTSAEGLRVMAGGTAVDATADNIYLDGRAESLISDHALVLRDITAEDIIDIQSESDIKTVGTIEATNAALGSDKNIELAEGKIEADTAILQAGKQLVQSADHTVHSTTTDATAKNGIALDGENNRLGTLFLDNEEGTVRVNNTDTLRLYAEENAGDIIVTNKDDAIMLMSDLTAHNITLDNTNGDIVLGSNNVTADSDITIRTHMSGDIVGAGMLKGTAGSVTLTADTGSIMVDDVTAGTDVNITTGTGDISMRDIIADRNVSVMTDNGNIGISTLDAEGNADITTEKGDITIDKAEVAGNATVGTTEGSIGITNFDAEGNADITTEKGDITIDNANVAGDATVGTTEGNVGIGSLATQGNADITTDNGDITIDNANVEGDASIGVTEGNVGITNLDAEGNADITTEKGDITVGAADVEGDATVGTTEGSIGIGSLATQGNAGITTDTGDITVGTADVAGDATVGTTEGNIGIDSLTTQSSADLTTGTGSITVGTADVEGNADITTGTGNITIDDADVEGDANIGTTEGNVGIGSLATQGNADLTTEKGDITVGTADVAGDASIGTTEGSIGIDSLTTQGSAGIITEKGDITVGTGNVEGDANIGTTEGNIGIGALDADGNAGITTGTGDITIGTADVAGDASIGTTEGNIGIDSLATQGSAGITTGTGDISINELVSKQSATLQTVDGAIDANRITADGMVEMFTQHGDITSDDKVVSLNDSVSVYAAKGDVDLNEVYAKQDASVGAGDGNVTVYTIDGENVIFTVEDRDKNLTADTVTAGDSVDITSNKTDIDTIIQRDDRDNMLTIAVRSPEADMPFEHLSIDHIVTKNGVIMSELWGDNIRIHVDAEKFYLPKLRIGKVGYFSTTSTSVTLYGIAPWLDSSNIQLWHDGANTDEWTSLMFLAPKRIATDAVYLNGDDWYDVYRQRRSGVDAMRLDLARENSGYRLEREAGRSADIYAPFIRYHLIDDSLWQADVPLAEDEDIVIEETI